jgi:hypothetical protein
MTTKNGPSPAGEASATRARVAREIATSILVGGVGPYVLYALLRPYADEVPCLIVGALLPVALEIVSLVRHRRLDPLSTLNLVALAMSVVLALSGGSARLLLVKESFVTGAIGGAFLLSLFGRRPAHYYLGRQFVTGDVPARVTRYEASWAMSPTMRRVLRVSTATWGIVMILELGLRVALVYRLTTEQMLVVGPVVFYTTTGCLIASTVAYARRARPQIEAERADLSVPRPSAQPRSDSNARRGAGAR